MSDTPPADETDKVPWADRFKGRTGQLVVALGAVAALITAFGDVADKVGTVWCKYADCREVPAPDAAKGSVVGNAQVEKFSSNDLLLSFEYPRNLFSVDTTQRSSGTIYLVDASGKRRVSFIRSTYKLDGDIRAERDREADALRSRGAAVTYIAPEIDRNLSNWYVISGIESGEVFYFRRVFVGDHRTTFEIRFPKTEHSTYEPVVDMIHRSFEIKG